MTKPLFSVTNLLFSFQYVKELSIVIPDSIGNLIHCRHPRLDRRNRRSRLSVAKESPHRNCIGALPFNSSARRAFALRAERKEISMRINIPRSIHSSYSIAEQSLSPSRFVFYQYIENYSLYKTAKRLVVHQLLQTRNLYDFHNETYS